MNKWISVKNSFPEERKQVLVCTGQRGDNYDEFPMITAFYEDGRFCADHFCEYGTIYDVTHWMELPELPELTDE